MPLCEVECAVGLLIKLRIGLAARSKRRSDTDCNTLLSVYENLACGMTERIAFVVQNLSVIDRLHINNKFIPARTSDDIFTAEAIAQQERKLL